MEKTSKKGSKTLLEAALRTLAKNESGEACSQLGLMYRRQNDWKKAKRWFEKAADLGDGWGALALDAHDLQAAESKGLSSDDRAMIADDVAAIFEDALEHRNVPAALANETYRIYRAIRDYEHDETTAATDGKIAQSGLLSETNIYSFARLILQEVSKRYPEVPEGYPFLREKGLAGLSLAMAVHDLGAVYERGEFGIALPNAQTAARLYAEAFIYHEQFENAAAFKNIKQDQEFAEDDLIERLILQNSLGVIAMSDDLEADCYEEGVANCRDVSVAIGEKLLELRDKDPKAPLIGRLLRVLEYVSEKGNIYAGKLQLALIRDGRLIKNSEELVTKILKRLAEADDHPSQSALAARLLSGKGGPKDPKKARVWYQKAAESWDDGAMAFLAQNYAAEAKKGSQAALLRRGHCFEHGLGVKADPQRAFECYLKLSDPLIRNARIALLEASRGNKERAQKYLEKARDYVAGHFDAKTKKLWKAYLDGCDLEGGITKERSLLLALGQYITVEYSAIDDHEITDFTDRVKRCSSVIPVSDLSKGDASEHFEAEKLVIADYYRQYGDPLSWAKKLRRKFSYRPVYLYKPEDRLPWPSFSGTPASYLERMLPRQKEYVFDTRIVFTHGKPQGNWQGLLEHFKARTMFTIETGTVVTSLKGNFGGQDNLRFLILSDGLKEITEPDFAKYHAAVIPAGDWFQVLGAHEHADRVLVILMHIRNYLRHDIISGRRLEADAQIEALLKPYYDRFDALDGTEPRLNFSEEYLAKADHLSLSQEHTSSLPSYFADPDDDEV